MEDIFQFVVKTRGKTIWGAVMEYLKLVGLVWYLNNKNCKFMYMIKYVHNMYDRRTRKIQSEDTFFYLQKRRRTAVSMTDNDGACWVCAHTFVIDDGVTSIVNAFNRGSARLGKITFLRTCPF